MKLQISEPMRPSIPDYGISEEKEGLITWEQINQWMEESKGYWISTTKKNGHPHSRPMWGIWFENCFYFGGGDTTQNYKNLVRSSKIQVHTESTEKVVIIDGEAKIYRDKDLEKKLDLEYQRRYNMPHPPPFFRVIPSTVFTWDSKDYAKTPTKFVITIEK